MNSVFKIFVFVLAVVSTLLAGYFYKELQKLKADPQALANEEIQALVEKVGRLIVLPEGETPTLATVSNPEELKKDQEFFMKAMAGDKVLIYTGAKKAYLYSVTLNKILEVAPVNIGDQAQQPVTPPPASQSDSN